MSSQVDAVYENGVFRPLNSIDWPERQKVTVSISDDREVEAVFPFEISAERWQRFCEALDAPAKEIPTLRRLLTEETILDARR